IGDINFCVTMFLDMGIQHELRERTMQACDAAFHDIKTRTTELGSRGKIQQPQRFSNTDMVLDSKVKRSRCSPAPYLAIVRITFSFRNTVMRQIGCDQQNLLQLSLNGLELIFGLLELITELRNFSHDRAHIFTFLFGDADLFGSRITFRLESLRMCLYGFALRFQRIELRNRE